VIDFGLKAFRFGIQLPEGEWEFNIDQVPGPCVLRLSRGTGDIVLRFSPAQEVLKTPTPTPPVETLLVQGGRDPPEKSISDQSPIGNMRRWIHMDENGKPERVNWEQFPVEWAMGELVERLPVVPVRDRPPCPFGVFCEYYSEDGKLIRVEEFG
jgi:hypothetical protein